MRKYLLTLGAAVMSLSFALTVSGAVSEDIMLPVRPRSQAKMMKAPVRKTGAEENPLLRIIPPTPFQGVLIGTSDWVNTDPEVGLYNFSATAPERSLIYKNQDMGSTYGTLIYDGKLFVMTYFEIFGTPFTSAAVYDLSNGEEINYVSGVSPDICSTSLAYDSSTGKVYGSFLNSNHTAHEFGILDMNTFTRSTISTLPGYLYGLSFTPDGRLVGLNPRTGNLYNVDKQTGALTLIGQTGITSRYATSGAVCPKTGYMYFAVCDDEEIALYRIDTNTAEAVKLYDFPDQAEIMGMSIPQPPFADMVPGPARSIETIFEGLNLNGTISFMAPLETYDGTPGEGTLNYTLSCNGNLVKEGETEWGAGVEVPFEVSEPEYCTFHLTFSNATGAGPAVEISKFIGESLKPATIESVNFELEGTSQKISWTPVTGMYYGGEFDPARLSYKVVRSADEAVVASGLTDTEFTDAFEEPGKQIMLSYTVIPVYDTTEGDPTVSDELVYGYVTPPYKETFSSARKPYVKTWTVVDADGDGVLNWTHDTTGGRIRTKANATSRDIYATQRIYLEPDRVYTVKYGVNSYSNTKTAHVSCWLSDSLEPDSFTRCLTEAEPVTNEKKTYDYFTAEFSVDTPGFYYVGLKNEGGTGTYNYVDNFEVQSPALSAAPAAPSEFNAVADPDGNLEVTLSFTLPELSAGGSTLSSLSGYEVKRGNTRVARVTTDVTPGQTVTIIDTPENSGITQYTVAAFNNAGHGVSANTSVFVGINVPGTVSDVTIAEPEEGYVTLGWAAPTVDKNGYPIKSSLVKYNILDSNRNYIAENVDATTYSFQALSSGRSDFVYYYIQTLSDAGESEFIVSSPLLAIGAPAQLPFAESFAEGKAHTLWATVNYTPDIPSTWAIVNEIPEFISADEDGGFVMSHSDDAGGRVGLQSSKIKLDCEHPTLVFSYFAIPESHNTIEPRIAVQGADFESLCTISVSETAQLGWQRVVIPLDQYVGMTVRLEMIANCVNNSQTHFDAISIFNCNPVDLSLVRVTAPEKMETWKENIFEVLVGNIGRNDVEKAVVTLYHGENPVDHFEIAALSSGEEIFMTLGDFASIDDEETLKYKVVIDVEGDDDLTNNESEIYNIPLALPTFPVVETISHIMNEEGIILSWEVPVITEDHVYDDTPLQLVGYRIYRNGEILEETVDPTFTDNNVNEGDHMEYAVSALYNLGESVKSASYAVDYSGVNAITGDNIMIRGEKSAIVVTGAAGLKVVVTDAAGIATGYSVDTDRFVVEVAAGVYMIRINGNTSKVYVK